MLSLNTDSFTAPWCPSVRQRSGGGGGGGAESIVGHQGLEHWMMVELEHLLQSASLCWDFCAHREPSDTK